MSNNATQEEIQEHKTWQDKRDSTASVHLISLFILVYSLIHPFLCNCIQDVYTSCCCLLCSIDSQCLHSVSVIMSCSFFPFVRILLSPEVVSQPMTTIQHHDYDTVFMSILVLCPFIFTFARLDCVSKRSLSQNIRKSSAFIDNSRHVLIDVFENRNTHFNSCFVVV